MAGKGFRYDGCLSEGFKVFSPYIDCNLKGRLLREAVFRTPFIKDNKFYNTEILNQKWEYIIVYDALITKNYLYWLVEHFPDSKIIFKYENLIGRAKHIFPKDIPEPIEIWTYDSGDSQKYGLNLFDSYIYYPAFIQESKEPRFDVFFIGRDKGRGEYLLSLERELNKLGLSTNFIITADGKFSRKKDYYQKELTYPEVTDYLAESKAVLNIALEGQKGITVRDAEAVYFKMKLITTNKEIINADFYNPNQVFILTDDNYSEIPKFLDTDFNPDLALLEKHTLDNFINEVCK